MPSIDPERARQFAVRVVRKLREAGFEAYWAGGCVRDLLLGRRPKDYDVATGATPDQVRRVFGFRRTLAVGKAFGVITVLGPRGAGQVEVATFRSDDRYTDGRHPDRVTFTSAEEDARRRDFTINGLFFDPIEQKVIDYVGGQEDLRRRLVRAIGDPRERIAEDKLRMLRAVRMTATFAFQLHRGTLAAIQEQAHEITVVSAERIAEELRRMLAHEHRRRAAELLAESGLWPHVFPELAGVAPGGPDEAPGATWRRALQILQRLGTATFPMAMAALVREVASAEARTVPVVRRIARRLRLARAELRETEFLLLHEQTVRSARKTPWSKLQRILVHDPALVASLLGYCRAVAETLGEGTADIDFCRQKLALPRAELDPPPLVDGHDLQAAGLPQGPAYRRVLEAVRDAQLDGRVRTKAEAMKLARSLFDEYHGG